MEVAKTGGNRVYCLFRYGGTSLAVSAGAVEAFIVEDRLSRMPLFPAPVWGLCTHRGAVLPIIRPAETPDDADREPEARRRVVLGLRTDRGLLGLLVDRSEVAIVEEDRGEPASVGVIAGRAVETPLPEGVVADGWIEREGRRHPLLHPGRTWAAVRERIARGYGAVKGDEMGAKAGSGTRMEAVRHE